MAGRSVQELDMRRRPLCSASNVSLTIGAVIFIFVVIRIYYGTNTVWLKESISSSDEMDQVNSQTQTESKNENLSGPSRNRPHIVFILADDYGFNDVGYKNPAMKTPNIDALAEDGVKLDNYYVQPICTPSRAQIMTGKHPIHLGLQHSLIWLPQPNCIPKDIPTVAEKLTEAGYKSHMTGKWHLGFYKKECLPTSRGFQSFLGLMSGRGDHYNHTNKWYSRPGDNFPTDRNVSGLDFREGEKPVWKYTGQYSTHIFAKRAEAIIEDHDIEHPLFLYVAFQAVHEPLEVPKKYIAPFSHIRDTNRSAYMGMTLCMDEAIGNITAALKRKGLWENTVLIFSSDNGGNVYWGANNWPLRGMKNTLWEGGVRALGFVTSPLLPESVRGTSNAGLIDASDWFPTLTEGIAGSPLQGVSVDGYNIWDNLRDGTPLKRQEILHNIDPDPIPLSLWKHFTHPTERQDYSPDMWSALRVNNWKIVTGLQDNYTYGWYAPPETGMKSFIPKKSEVNKTIWLFNIKKDPSEKNDLSKKKPKIVRELLRRLERYQKGSVPVRFPDMDASANPELHHGVWDSWGSL